MPIQRITIPWDKINDGAHQVGDGAGNFARKIAKEARNTACTVYRDFPGAVIPNPASNFLQGMWDSICSDDSSGLPPPPAPPFEGGQCNTDYTVVFEYINTRNAGTTWTCGDIRPTRSHSFSGSLKRIYHESGYWYFEYKSTTGSLVSQIIKANFGGQIKNLGYTADCHDLLYSYPTGSSVRVQSITRVDGLPDDCGSPPPEYEPPPSDYTPPSGDYTIQPRPDNPDWNITVPFVWVDASPEFNFRPKIDVGGIDVSFDLGGINLEYNPEFAPPEPPPYNPRPEDLLPPATNIDDTNIITNNNTNTTNINNNVTNTGDTIINNDNSNTTEIKDKITQENEEELPVALGSTTMVRVSVDSSNYTGKWVFSDSGGEYVVFAGYLQFTSDGIPLGEELPIRRAFQQFEYPRVADGFRLIPQNNAILSAVTVPMTVPLPHVTWTLPEPPP